MWRELYSSASAITNTWADLVMLAASQSNYANETAARLGGAGGLVDAGDWQLDLCIEIINK